MLFITFLDECRNASAKTGLPRQFLAANLAQDYARKHHVIVRYDRHVLAVVRPAPYRRDVAHRPLDILLRESSRRATRIEQ
jgi:hypothetical protein